MRFADALALALEIKLITGGSAATAARFAEARGAIGAMPARRQNTGMARRLKRAETYLARRGKRGGKRGGKKMAKKRKGFYSPVAGRNAGGGMTRPTTLAEMRIFASDARAAARTNGERLANLKAERALARNQRFAQLAAQRLSEWERTKRPPKGFRLGK